MEGKWCLMCGIGVVLMLCIGSDRYVEFGIWRGIRTACCALLA